MANPLLPCLGETSSADGHEALRFPDGTLTFAALREQAAAVAAALIEHPRVALWATPSLATAVGVCAGLLAGVPVVPVNPKMGVRELEHVLTDSAPSVLLVPAGETLPEAARHLPRLDPLTVTSVARATTSAAQRSDEPDLGEDSAALILYTSGTTGSPKGVILPRRAIASNVDALAEAWEWGESDVLVHALPVFHAHGLVLGLIGALRLSCPVIHLGAFGPEAIRDAIDGGATMLFGVPTMYSRLADAAERDPSIAAALRSARVLVSGSAALPAAVHARIEAATGQRVVERYGLTETLMNCAVRVREPRKAGYVGRPIDGVDLKLLDDDGAELATADDATIGEIAVRGPNLFSGYLNNPDATARSMRDGWFLTGDLATRGSDGYLRIVGRRTTDLIKTGGYRVGAGEVENALLEHPSVAEAAVKGLPDDDLGERIVAWVVLREGAPPPTEQELMAHVSNLISGHKRPRAVYFTDELPRNDMGKVVKSRLGQLS